MSRHYANKRRPLSHYLFGYLGTHLPTLSRVAPLTNLVLGSKVGGLANRMLGIDKNKKLPRLSPQSFDRWVKSNCDGSDSDFYWFGQSSDPAVVIWVDSFNNHYRPELLQAALSVMKRHKRRVAVAKTHFCCGRPLYEHGFLDQAEKQLKKILSGFYSALPSDASIVVLEPSCLSVFRDELLRLFPSDERAADLAARCETVSDVMYRSNAQPSRTLASGILHLHCHHKALAVPAAEREMLNGCFETLIEPEVGCCGMAGSFGIRKKTKAIGDALYSRKLGSTIEEHDQSTVIVTNGFSCAEQILDKTSGSGESRRIMHPVEVIDACY